MNAWLKDTSERVVSSAAESVIAVVTADQISSAFQLDWKAVAGVAGLTALVTVLKSLAAMGKSGTVSPASFVRD